jgi:hypothetical protein
MAFERETRTIALDRIVPLKPYTPALKNSRKFEQIAASIRAIGLVELPVVIANRGGSSGTYLLLDGLLRIEALKEQGIQEVECIVSTDDEAYTYNKRINRLSAVQEHRMIVRAVERGVSVERIADALNLNVLSVQRRFRLLDGICDEAAELLADKPCPMAVISLLKCMKPLRQMYAAELIVDQNNYTSRFAKGILATTPPDQLLEPPAKPIPNVTHEQIARLERELDEIRQTTKFAEDSYGLDNLCLTVAKTYLAKLLRNTKVVRWLKRHQPDYLAEFQIIAELRALSTT